MTSRHSTLQGILLGVAVPGVATLLSLPLGCKAPQTMVSAPGVPASQGTVEATIGDKGNTNISIRVKHLAPPSKMAPDATVYVVWLQPPDAEKQNIGALVLNENLEGSLDTVSAHTRFQISVTPEPSGSGSQPTHDPVFTAEVIGSK